MTHIKRFVVLGDAGAGKSAFINTMFNYCYGTRVADEVFTAEKSPAVKLAIPSKHWTDLLSPNNPSSERDINDQTKSQTMATNTYSLQLDDDRLFELIDTPGFNDTEGLSIDQSNLQHIEKTLGNIPYLNGIIIVVNGAMVRLTTSFHHFLHLLHEILPNNLQRNVCVIMTNCDQLSCNLDSHIFRQLLHVTDKTIFRIQNNIFRWDRIMHSNKIMRNFRHNFEDVIETINKIIPVLDEFNDVSTEDFARIITQQSIVDQTIQDLIKRIISLLYTYREQVNTNNAIIGAEATIKENKNWENQYEITAIKWIEVPSNSSSETIDDSSQIQKRISTDDESKTKSAFHSITSWGKNMVHKMVSGQKKTQDSDSTNKETNAPSAHQQASSTEHNETSKMSSGPCKTCSRQSMPSTAKDMSSGENHLKTYKPEKTKVHLTLPNNNAISHHEDALKQVSHLGNQLENIKKKQDTLRHELHSLFEQLTNHVVQMRAINKHADLLQKHKDLLNEFSEKIKTMDDTLNVKDYFEKTIDILRHASFASDLPNNSEPTTVEQMDTEN